MKETKSFLITIDTEGDNLWSMPSPARVATKNAMYLPRFQELCEKYQFKPTYLTNYEMANSDRFLEFGKDVLTRNTGEIGMHLHAWDMPPNFRLTDDDLATHPYLIEYPEHIMREKISIMTNLLEEKFQCKMVSHRAGRWSFNELYAKILLEMGYKVDCSVTPNVSWKKIIGDTQQKGGTDFSQFPENSYFMDISDISTPGKSRLLEVPMTVVRSSYNPAVSLARQICSFQYKLRNVFYRIFPTLWLRPNGSNLDQMHNIIDLAVAQNRDYVEFMLHSSELMPGGSPTFPDERTIEQLYDDIEDLFQHVAIWFKGRTLQDYYKYITDSQVGFQEPHLH